MKYLMQLDITEESKWGNQIDNEKEKIKLQKRK